MVALVAIGILAATNLETLYGRMVFNVAQLSRLHGRAAMPLFSLAFSTAGDSHIRHEYARLMIRRGEYVRAADLLKAVDRSSGHVQDQKLAFIANVQAGRHSFAQTLASTLGPEDLEPASAARLASQMAKDGQCTTHGICSRLLEAALRVSKTSPSQLMSVQLLLSQLASGNDQAVQRLLVSLSRADRSPAYEDQSTQALWAETSWRNPATDGVINGDLSIINLDSNLPMGWKYVNYADGGQRNVGLFKLGLESDANGKSIKALRIDGIYESANTGLEPPRVGIAQIVPINSDKSYEVTFRYRTACVDVMNATAWSLESGGALIVGGFQPMANTSQVDWSTCTNQPSEWRVVREVVPANSSVYSIVLMPRLNGIGTIWYDDFMIRSL